MRLRIFLLFVSWAFCSGFAFVTTSPSFLFGQHHAVATPQPTFHHTVRGLDPTKNPSEYVFHSWQTEQGLPQNSAYALCQTRDGYIWIGTAEGLARYDGARFYVFNTSNTPELAHNWISSLLEDSDGRLWIGTFGGGVSRFYQGTFSTINDKNGLPSSTVRTILQDTDGAMWFGSNGGLTRLQNKTFTTYTKQNGLGNMVVTALCKDHNGTLWIGTRGGGLSQMKNGRFTTFSTANGLASNTVLSVFEDRDSSIWIGTTNGLHRFYNGSFALYTTQNGLSSNNVQSIIQDRNGTLWFGTASGMSRLLPSSRTLSENKDFTRYSESEALNRSNIPSLLYDSEGALWIGTADNGIARLHNGVFSSLAVQRSLPQHSHVFQRSILSLATDTKGVLWLGTSLGLHGYSEGRITHSMPISSFGGNEVYSLLPDSAGGLWIGTKKGIHYQRNGVFKLYTLPQESRGTPIFSLALDPSSGKLWIGTQGEGLYCFHNGTFTHFTKADGLPHDIISSLLLSKDGALWIGTWGGGVVRFKDNIFTTLSTDNGLSHNQCMSFWEDSAGAIWMGTFGGGINRYKEGKISTVTSAHGLYNDVAYSILCDNNAHVWVSCNKGVFRVPYQELNAVADGHVQRLHCQAFGVEDGMKSAECNGGTQPTAWKSNDGRLWFATIRGAVSINPADIFTNPLPPPVIIESIYGDSMALDIRTPVRISPGTQKMEFHYTATSLLVPEKVRFRYMLEGYDESWVEAGTRRVAYYTNLPRGRLYRFRVSACNNDGVWNEDGAAVNFRLESYIWETWWAYSLYAVIVISGAIAFIRYRERVQHRALRQLYREREAQLIYEKNLLLEEANVRLGSLNKQLSESNANLSALNEEKSDIVGVVAHDLKNPIIGIQKLAYSLEGQARKSGLLQMQESAAIIKHTAERMFAMIQQLLRMHAAEFGSSSSSRLTPITINLGELAEKLRRDWQERAEHHSVLVAIALEGDKPIMAHADPYAFLQILENLLSNAVKASSEGGVITIRLGYKYDDELQYAFVEVHDTGKGMSIEQQQSLFSKFIRLSSQPNHQTYSNKSSDNDYSSGLGLYIVKKLTDAMQGRITCKSTAGVGTFFTLLLPVTAQILSPTPYTNEDTTVFDQYPEDQHSAEL